MRNKYTRNFYEFYDGYVIGYVYNQKQIITGNFIIDTEDYEKIKDYKWCKNTLGYIVTWKDGKNQYLHHIITGHIPNQIEVVDHINKETRDNRKSNLRVCSKSINSMNSSKVSGKSKYRGVYFDKSRNKYVARLMKNKKLVLFKRFTTEEEAATAYNEAFQKHYEEVKNVNVG